MASFHQPTGWFFSAKKYIMKNMDKSKMQTLKGFRDFLPEDAEKRQYAIDIIRKTFENFGFEPLETPALEYQEVLLGKYGDEADKLVYTFTDKGGRDIALRYDQTVPTARVLAMYQQQLPLPWRRYQIQKVWRADKPQKGRFREFLQCDPDIYGSTSPLSDAEIIAVTSAALINLGFKKIFCYLNDRKILFNLMDSVKIPEELQLSVIQTIDKLDRKTKEETQDELIKKGLPKEKIKPLFELIESSKPTENIKKVTKHAINLGVDKNTTKFQARLARGLDYYTSTIFEFKIEGYKAGSVAGGGRYDNLIEQLSGVSIPAVGIAFGFDRIIEAMGQFELFPAKKTTTDVLVSVFNPELTEMSTIVTKNLRQNNINTEIFPDENASLKKQLKYADKKGIRWLVVIGPDEVKKDKVVLKNLLTGHQEEIKLKDIINKIKTNN
jgi:histidyl-tRNA synthetase